jgi:hypothetical protein
MSSGGMLNKAGFDSCLEGVISDQLDHQDLTFLSFALTNIFNAYVRNSSKKISALEVGKASGNWHLKI